MSQDKELKDVIFTKRFLLEEREPKSEEKTEQSAELSDEQQTESVVDTDFFDKWKERHNAYLVAHGQAPEDESKKESAEEDTEDPDKSMPETTPDSEPEESPAESDSEESKITKSVRTKWGYQAILKMILVGLLMLATLLVSVYFLSPLSKKKLISVAGTSAVTTEEVIKSSQISDEEYAFSTFFHQGDHAQQIAAGNQWIESATIRYQFPNVFHIQVKEYVGLGYVLNKNSYRQLISSGEVVGKALAESQLPKHALIIQLTDSRQLEQLGKELGQIDSKLCQQITGIRLTPSKATSDLLTLSMKDGNKVLIPIGDIHKKLPFYTKIAKQLTTESTIDMEVGIYSYKN